MKKLIAGAVGIMLLMTLGCSTTELAPASQAPRPPANEAALQWYELGRANVQAGNYEDAVKNFTQAIAANPNFTDAYYSRGRVLGRLGKHEQAIGDFTQTISLNPEDANAYADRGAAYGSMGQHGPAISDFTRAIALNPDFAGAYYNRAIGYFAEKKCSQAQRDLRRAQELGYQKIRPGFIEELKKTCPEN